MGDQDDIDALYGDVGGGGGGEGAPAVAASGDAPAQPPTETIEDVYRVHQPRTQQPAPPPSRAPQAGGAAGGAASLSLYVGGMNWWTTDAELESACAEYGRIREVKFFEEKSNGKSKGYALVTFADIASARACQAQLNG